jgi:acyl-coenzyme A synthetase/AMP-(fatty) acid ligase
MKNEVDTQEVQDDENTKATVSEEKNKNQKKFKRFRFQKLKVLLEMIYNLLQRKMMKKKSNVLKISKSDKIEIEASQWNQLYVKKE